MGHSRMILTDSLFLVTSEEKEKEVVSGECSSTSPKSTIQDGEEESSSSHLETGLSHMKSEERFKCVCFSAFFPAHHCSSHFCKFYRKFKYFSFLLLPQSPC